MSNTPMTDAFDGEDSEWSPAKPKNWPAFSRKLERELNAANQIAKKYEDRYFDCLERIKRLKEAGDELMYDNDDMANINRWHKAKDSKP